MNDNEIKAIKSLFLAVILLVFIAVVSTRQTVKYEHTRKQRFAYGKYGDRDVRVDTASMVMYDKELRSAIIDLSGKPIPYNGKFPWE